MVKKRATLEKEQAYREAFLANLNRKLAAPTSDWPTVRCWVERTLDKVFRQVREELAASGITSDLSHRSLLDWICHLRLASSLRIEGESIYLIEIGANAETEIDPLELLMTGKPLGVVCYFSSLAFHSLTTQRVEHHHVAELRPSSPPVHGERAERESSGRPDTVTSSAVASRTYGTQLFSYMGVPFYSTRRSARLVPGVQSRAYGPRTRLRITTLEQTLLDTLYKPFHCGGPEVVFEAWQEAIASRRIDEERLVEYLRTMNYPATARRLGAMLEILGCTAGNELKQLLDRYHKAMDRESPFARISLLPGIEYQNLNEYWLVKTP